MIEVLTEFNHLFVFQSVNAKYFLWIHEAFVSIFHFKTAIFLANLWLRMVVFDLQTEISL